MLGYPIRKADLYDVEQRMGLLKVRLTPDLWGREVPAGRMPTCLQHTPRSSVMMLSR